MNKSKIKNFIFIFMFAGMLSLGSAFSMTVSDAKASTVKTNLITTTFSGENISNVYLTDRAEVEKEYDSLHFERFNSYGSAVALTDFRINDYAKFTFEIKSLQFSSDSVVWIAFGGDSYSSMQFDYEQCLWMQSTNSVLCRNNGAEFEPKEEDVVYYQGGRNLFEESSGKIIEAEIEVEKTASNQYAFMVSYKIDGVQFDKTISYENVALTENKYVSISCFNYSFDLISCKIENAQGERVFYDDFSQNTLAYYGKSVEGKNWYANSSAYSEDVVRIGKMGTLSMKDDSSIISKFGFGNTAKSSVSYHVSFLCTLQKLSDDAEFLLSFGMPNSDLTLDKVLSFRENQNTVEIYYREGTVAKKVKTMLKATFTHEIPFSISFMDNYSVSVDIDGVGFSVANVDYDGYFGIATVKNNGEVQLNLDNIVVDSFDSVCYTSEDCSNNFSGLKKDATNTELPYINDQKYFLGNGVSVEEGYLSFYDSNEYSNFAVLKKYDEYAVQFDVEVNSTGTTGQKFGLSIGKSSPALFYEKCSTVSFFYNNYVTGKEPTTSIKGYNCVLEDGGTETDAQGYQFWPTVTKVNNKTKKSIRKYNFLFVVRNRTVEVYYKADEEDASKLSILRAKFVDLNTNGYMSIFGSNGISFDITDFKITNLGFFEKGNNGFDAIYNFNDGVCDLEVNGTNYVQDGMLFVNDGSFTLDASNNFLAQFRINGLTDDLTIGLTDTQKVVLDKGGKNVSFIVGSNTEKIDLPKTINFNIGYTNLFFRIVNNTVCLGLSKNERADDEIYLSPIRYEFNDGLQNVVCTVSSPGNQKFDFICAYDFSKPYTAKTVHYADDPNNGNPWIKKPLDPSIQTDNGCGATVSLTGMLNAFVITAVAGGVLIRKRRNENEKSN